MPKIDNFHSAPSMFALYAGTTQDASLLTYTLPSLLFPLKFQTNIALGVSLGGHTAWLSLLHDPRIHAAVIMIGCPDYRQLMYHRARLSKRSTYTSSSPPGSEFFGSKDFPEALLDGIASLDPSAYFEKKGNDGEDINTTISNIVRPTKGKKALILSGGADKLVPYKEATEPFLGWLKEVADQHAVQAQEGPPGGFLGEDDGEGFTLDIKDVVLPGVKHEVTQNMVEEALDFVGGVVDGSWKGHRPRKQSVSGSKI
jgi:hypothetical protein